MVLFAALRLILATLHCLSCFSRRLPSDNKDVEPFVAALRRRYYSKRLESGAVLEKDMPQVVFASHPAPGAALFKLAAKQLL